MDIYTLAQYMNTNFTHTFICYGDLSMMAGSSIQAARIGIYGNNVLIQGKLNTTGLGCQSDEGLGKGIPGT